jgi:hypothetical protein
MTDVKAELDAELARAEEEVTRTREANSKLADAFRADPSEGNRAHLKRGAAALAVARDAVEAAKAVLAVFAKTGSRHGLVADNGQVFGTIAVLIPPGTTRADREKRIDDALTTKLAAIADELGVVLGTAPSAYTKERPGRDGEGHTVFDVSGRVEGDVLVPFLSKAAKNRA